MGIYDRDYYRGEGYSFLGSLADRGQACKWLIGLNIVFFILQHLVVHHLPPERVLTEEGWAMYSPPAEPVFTDALILAPDKVMHGQVWRLLTYGFLHAGLMHILFNMLFLWWFGSEMEDIYGTKEFLSFYLLSVFLGGLVFFGLALAGIPPHPPGTPPTACLGASGGVMAVLILCALHYPYRIIYLFLLLPVPIWAFALFEVVGDAFGFLGGNAGNTAVSVHLAGAAFAFVYYKQHWRVLNWIPDLRGWRRHLTGPRLRVYREDEPPTPVSVAAPAPRTETDEHLEAEIDAILEKISRTGKESLTDHEQQVLLRASEIFKRKRT